MLTTEDIDRMKYPEIGERFIEDCNSIYEEIAKFLILFTAEWTWPFMVASYIIISIYVVYWR